MSGRKVRAPKIHFSGLRRNARLERLAKRVFQGCSDITLRPFSEAEKGFSGAFILRGEGTTTNGYPIIPCILKVGPTQKIRQEFKNFRDCVRLIVDNAPQVYGYRKEGKLAAIAYTKIGGSWLDVDTLKKHYAETNTEQLKLLINNLFSAVMGPWGRPSTLQAVPIWNIYALEQPEIKRVRKAARQLGSGVSRLGPFDPIKYCTHLLWGKVFGGPPHVHFSTVHGDLNSRNILFNTKENKLYLIDFSHTGPGHHLRDFAKLEADIKFVLMDPDLRNDSDSLRQCQYLDLALDNPWSRIQYRAIEGISDRHIKKAWEVISYLRQLADSRMQSGKKGHEVIGYRVALIHYTLKALGFDDIDDSKRLFAYRSAGRMSQLPLDRKSSSPSRRTSRRKWSQEADIVVFVGISGDYARPSQLPDHNLGRYFSVCGCMFRKADYEQVKNQDLRAVELVNARSMGIISVVIDKQALPRDHQSYPDQLLELGFGALLEAFGEYLTAEDKIGQVVIVAGGEKEESRALDVYKNIYDKGTRFRLPSFFAQLMWRRATKRVATHSLGIRTANTLAGITKRQTLFLHGKLTTEPKKEVQDDKCWATSFLASP